MGGLAGPGLDEQGQEARGQPRPLGAADRGRAGRPHPGDVPVGQGPQRRPCERPRRPAGGRGGPDPDRPLGRRAARLARAGADAPGGGDGRSPAAGRAPGGRDRPQAAASWAATTPTRSPTRSGPSWPRCWRPRPRSTPTSSCSPASGWEPSSWPAEAAAEAGVPYVAVLPYPDPDSQWPAASRAGVPGPGRRGAVDRGPPGQGRRPPSSWPAPPCAGATPGWPATPRRPSPSGTARTRPWAAPSGPCRTPWARTTSGSSARGPAG